MIPGIYNLTIPQGTDQSLPFTIAGYDLRNYTAKLQARTHYGAPTAFVTLTDTSGITLGNGTFSLTFTNAQTNAMPLGKWVYDLEITDTSGKVSRVIQGSFTVTPQVTV